MCTVRAPAQAPATRACPNPAPPTSTRTSSAKHTLLHCPIHIAILSSTVPRASSPKRPQHIRSPQLRQARDPESAPPRTSPAANLPRPHFSPKNQFPQASPISADNLNDSLNERATRLCSGYATFPSPASSLTPSASYAVSAFCWEPTPSSSSMALAPNVTT